MLEVYDLCVKPPPTPEDRGTVDARVVIPTSPQIHSLVGDLIDFIYLIVAHGPSRGHMVVTR